MSRKPWYEKGLRFECTRSGNCCRNHGSYTYVYLAEADAARIAAHLELDPREFLDRYCKIEEGWITLRMDRPACPFQEESGDCGIYPVRPKQCATWPFWEENLKEETWHGAVKDCCPGIGKGRLYTAEEIEQLARETEEWYGADE
jgi:hypothetical protein